MGVALERLLHHQRQRSKSLAHVGMASRQPNTRAAGKRNRRQPPRAVNAPMTLDRVPASGAPSIVTRTCAPKAIVIDAGVGDSAGDDAGSAASVAIAHSAASTATHTGTNAGCSPSAANCRRQRYNRLALTPAPRAISVTTAPGAFIAATSRALSSAPQRRRRSTEAITSIRSLAI